MCHWELQMYQAWIFELESNIFSSCFEWNKLLAEWRCEGNTQSFSWSCKACFHHHGEPQQFLITSSCRFLEISPVCLGCTHEIRHASDALDVCAHIWTTEFSGHILSKVYKFTALTLSLAFAAEISVSLRLLLWLESSSFTLAMEEPSKTPVTHLPCS